VQLLPAAEVAVCVKHARCDWRRWRWRRRRSVSDAPWRCAVPEDAVAVDDRVAKEGEAGLADESDDGAAVLLDYGAVWGGSGEREATLLRGAHG
jgi:hypothetical protein